VCGIVTGTIEGKACRWHVRHQDVDHLLICRGSGWHRNGPASHALRNSRHRITLLIVLPVVVRESDDMEEMEEVGVWVLCEGGGVENVSVLRSGSKGELDGGASKEGKECGHSSET
jgi:hypothetical protein